MIPIVSVCQRGATVAGSIAQKQEGKKRTGAVHVGLDEDIDAADSIQLDFHILVLVPVAHEGHVVSAGVVVLGVPCIMVNVVADE